MSDGRSPKKLLDLAHLADIRLPRIDLEAARCRRIPRIDIERARRIRIEPAKKSQLRNT